MRGRILLTERRSGAWNMALDEALLLRATSETITARLYSWSPATLTIGYFQRIADVPPGLRSRFPIVRRPTGGGALLHFPEEITISLSGLAPERAPTPRAAVELLLSGIGPALLAWGWRARLLGCAGPSGPPGASPAGAPFLCGARSQPLDLVVDTEQGSRKILGSAQRRRGRAWLIHGGLRGPERAPAITDPTEATMPELPPDAAPAPLAAMTATRAPGLTEPVIPPGADPGVILLERLIEGFGALFSPPAAVEAPTPQELLLANQLTVERYADPAWSHRL